MVEMSIDLEVKFVCIFIQLICIAVQVYCLYLINGYRKNIENITQYTRERKYK